MMLEAAAASERTWIFYLMTDSRLPPHLLALVNDGTMLARYAQAVVAYAGDLATIAVPPGAERSRGGGADAGGYREGSGKAEQRVKAAQQAMGRSRSSVMRLVGVQGESFAAAAHDLGYATLYDVRREFLYAAGDLTQVYTEFRYRSRRGHAA